MSNKPTDINAFRNAKAQPDPDCIQKDEYGRPLYTFLLEYEMDDRRYGAEIIAYDEEEARRRIEAMRSSLCYVGELYSRVPC